MSQCTFSVTEFLYEPVFSYGVAFLPCEPVLLQYLNYPVGSCAHISLMNSPFLGAEQSSKLTLYFLFGLRLLIQGQAGWLFQENSKAFVNKRDMKKSNLMNMDKTLCHNILQSLLFPSVC